jgi:protein TonB
MSQTSNIVAASNASPKALLGRSLAAMLAAVVVTFALYWLMAELVATGREALTEAKEGRLVDFVRVKQEQQLNIDKPKPKKPPKPETPPPDAPVPQQSQQTPQANTVDIGHMSVDADVAVDAGFGLSASDGEYLPIVKVAPVYPRRAAQRGIEGHVVLSFTVNETGAVVDPVVVESVPPGVFDRAAIRAALKFKYKPRVEDGKAVPVPGVEHLITFQLEK